MTEPPKPGDLLHKQTGRQRTFKIPDLVSDRLDDLCAVLNGDEGTTGKIQRQDLLAALVAVAPEELRSLEKLIDEYRNAKVRDALVGDAKGADVIELRAVKPGRRPPSA